VPPCALALNAALALAAEADASALTTDVEETQPLRAPLALIDAVAVRVLAPLPLLSTRVEDPAAVPDTDADPAEDGDVAEPVAASLSVAGAL